MVHISFLPTHQANGCISSGQDDVIIKYLIFPLSLSIIILSSIFVRQQIIND